jgi:hypothetical protein
MDPGFSYYFLIKLVDVFLLSNWGKINNKNLKCVTNLTVNNSTHRFTLEKPNSGKNSVEWLRLCFIDSFTRSEIPITMAIMSRERCAQDSKLLHHFPPLSQLAIFIQNDNWLSDCKIVSFSLALSPTAIIVLKNSFKR